jgi:hypothetical protein
MPRPELAVFTGRLRFVDIVAVLAGETVIVAGPLNPESPITPIGIEREDLVYPHEIHDVVSLRLRR